MYLLKLRRDEAVVPSTLLWTRLVADVEANAPWQKLRRSLLLLLQLLLVVILALLAARPFLERPAGLARDIVLVMDTSASMAATDVVPDRLTAAKLAADRGAARPADGRQGQRHRRRPERPDRGQRIDRPEPRPPGDRGRHRDARARGDLGDALELASKLAARSGDAQVLVATDAALATDPTGAGRGAGQGPAGRARPQEPGDRRAGRPDRRHRRVTRSVFVSVANLDLERASRRLELWGDGSLLEVRDVPLEAQARADVIIDDLAADVRTLEVRLVGSDPAVVDRAGPAGRRRPRLGRHPARPDAADPRRRRGRSVPRDRAVLPAERRAVRRRSRTSTGRPRSARTAGRGTSSSSRASCRRRCRARRSSRSPRRARATSARWRHADEPGHRHARPRRAGPALRRPVDDPHRRGLAADHARLGADDHPGAARRAAAVRGHRATGCRARCSRSSRAAPTCRSRSPSRSCSPT